VKPIPLGSAKVTVKGQITIPKDVRETLEVAAGDTVFFFKSDKTVIMTKRISLSE
jgi:AbrB family looped-hinge helix DNA binding protein